ncbi:MAG: hypothetical protein JO055_15865 [Alphaproteobacteria bacterium]|nr:hypothetical protein [Alphaproteobacteria bacterium]
MELDDTVATPSADAAVKVGDFWHGQDKILDCMQVFVRGWFERRHVGTQAALETAQRMCMAKTPIDVARELQEWAAGSLQRIAQDGVALQREAMDIGEAMIDASRYQVPT